MLFVKLHKFVPYVYPSLLGVIPQRLKISRREVVERVLGVRKRLVQLYKSPCITLQVFLVLRVYSPKLAIQRRRIE